jgi:hypothetical protein
LADRLWRFLLVQGPPLLGRELLFLLVCSPVVLLRL